MLAIPLVLVPLAFVAGVYLWRRAAPLLADTPTGAFASGITEIVAGAAGTALALNVYLAIRAATEDLGDGFGRADAIARNLVEGVWQVGLLLGVAMAVHLLAPAPEAPDE